MSDTTEHQYSWDGSPERLENAFDELYFAIGAETEEERQQVDDVVYDTVASVLNDYREDSFSAEDVPEASAHLQAAFYAQNLGEALRIDDETRDGFYDSPAEDRIDYMKDVQAATRFVVQEK